MSYPYLETGRSHILAPLRAGCGSRSAGMLAKVGRYCMAQHHEDSPEIPRDIRRYYTMQKFRQLMEKTERLEVKPKALILCIPQSLLAGKVGIILPVPPPTSARRRATGQGLLPSVLAFVRLKCVVRGALSTAACMVSAESRLDLL